MKHKRKVSKLGAGAKRARAARDGGSGIIPMQTPPSRRLRERPDPRAGGAFSVRDFCAAHSISVAQYYIMKQAGMGPREFRAGRILISYEAAEEWRRQREAAAAQMSPVPDNG